MRSVLSLAVLLAAAGLAATQEKAKTPDEIPPRFGLPYKPKAYPQASPKEALASVLEAADKGEVNYLVAHLLDPAFVDVRLADRAKQVEPTVEAELVTLREFQRKNPDKVVPETRLPDDAGRFKARVAADAQARVFAQLVRDVREKFVDDPEVLKDLRRFYRGGTFPEPGAAGDAARVGHPDVKDRAVFLKKSGDRWYVENRQTDEKAAEPKKEPEPKKE